MSVQFCFSRSTPIIVVHLISQAQHLKLGSRQRVTSAGNLVVKQGGQEVGIVLASHLGGKVLSGKVELVALGGLGGELVGLLLEKLEGVRLVDALALGGGDAVLHPLPELGAGNLGGGGILPVVVVSMMIMVDAKEMVEKRYTYIR